MDSVDRSPGDLAAYPKLFGVYYTNLFVTFAVFAVLPFPSTSAGLYRLLSFGHAIFFGFGGYGTALA
jgi:ABC-type branched-subunit amino acid transport system permease subunit